MHVIIIIGIHCAQVGGCRCPSTCSTIINNNSSNSIKININNNDDGNCYHNHRQTLCAGRRLPLPINLQHTLWACGLRGAVAYGLAVNLPNIGAESDEGIPAIESATLVIVLVSTLLFGGITGEPEPPPPPPHTPKTRYGFFLLWEFAYLDVCVCPLSWLT